MAPQTATRKPLTFRPSPEIKERLDALAKATNRPVSFYLNTLLEEHLADIEHAYELHTRAEAARRGEARTYTLDEARAELGL